MTPDPSRPRSKPNSSATWRRARLYQLGRIVTGKTPPSNIAGSFGGRTPFVTPSDMDGRRTISQTGRFLSERGTVAMVAARVPAGAVMVSCIGSDMGKVALAGRDCVTNQQINSIIVDSGDDPLFVYYNLSNRKHELLMIASGSAQPILNKAAFGRVEILLPPVAEQHYVAGVLSALDDKIELNRKIVETLEAMARTIFKSWFVNFDPVHAKIEGCDTGLPTEIADLFPAGFQDSELGEIPSGWKIATLDTLASIEGGKQLRSTDCLTHGHFPVFGANGIMGFAQQATHDSFVIAFGRVGANCGTVRWSCCGAWINNNASAVVPKIAPEFVLQTMLNIDFHSMRTGSAQPFIPNSTLASVKMLYPPQALLAAFCAVAAPIRFQQSQLENGATILAGLRDLLLPKLVSGDVRLPHAEAAGVG
jgi:type I restriction enzyme, S subunit